MTVRPAYLAFALAAFVATTLVSQELRSFRKIPTPRRPGASGGHAAVKTPVDRGVVSAAVQQVASDWTNRELKDKLADNFQQKDRLLESSQLRVPRDAVMQVESTRNIHTLNQRETTGADGSRTRISVVSATVNTRIICNDPASGFVSVPGENEIVFEVIEELQ